MTVLLLGTSIDHQAILFTCEKIEESRRKYYGWERANLGFQYNTCEFDGFRIGRFMHWGAGDPPHHPAAREDTAWKSSTNQEHILDDAPLFAEEMLGTRDPDIVVVQSVLWDTMNWGYLGGATEETAWNSATPKLVAQWCYKDFPAVMSWVTQAFPNSIVVFRTIPTMQIKNVRLVGRAKEGLEVLNNCLKHHLAFQYGFIDYRQIVDDLISAGVDGIFQNDGYHLSAEAGMRYLNAIMNHLVGVKKYGCNAPSCHGVDYTASCEGSCINTAHCCYSEDRKACLTEESTIHFTSCNRGWDCCSYCEAMKELKKSRNAPSLNIAEPYTWDIDCCTSCKASQSPCGCNSCPQE